MAMALLEKSADQLELTVLAPPWGQLPEVAGFLKDEWRLIGINLVVEPVPGATQLNGLIRSGEYDLLPVDNYGVDPGILNDVFLDSSFYSASRAPHPQLNDLLIRAAFEQDPASRREPLLPGSVNSDERGIALANTRERADCERSARMSRCLRYDAYGFYPQLANVKIKEPRD